MTLTPVVRVRFAPSPTGNPHVGNFRTALYNYLFARRMKGLFLLRIEDTDRERSKPEFTEAILSSLRWMGMAWDEEPVFQSTRLVRHQQEANRLLAEGKAYRCRCTPDELETRRQDQMAAGKNPMYDGRCREKNYPDDSTSFCIRLKTPKYGTTAIHDIVRGEVVIDNAELDDLVLVRTEGTPTYNFAVVVDDHDMEITHVIRGDDHLNNTIRQVVLYQELGYPRPEFCHLPQILGEDRTRLSKRHGATGVLEYRAQGYLPDAMINYLARLGWSHGDQEVFTRDQLIEVFSLENINKSSAIFDTQKLLWLNGEHIRAKSPEDLQEAFIQYAIDKGYFTEEFCRAPENADFFRMVIVCTRERAKTLDEIYQKITFVFPDRLTFDEAEARKTFTESAVSGLDDLLEFAEPRQSDPPNKEEWEKAFHDIIEKRAIKMKVLAPAVRLALTGASVSPPIFDVIDLLGLEKVIVRLRAAIDYSKALAVKSE